MGLRANLSKKRTHFSRLGKGGLDFLKGVETKNEGEIIKFHISNYKHPLHLRNKTSDIPTFYQCIFDKEYDIKLDFEPNVIFDLGANIGLTTVFFKNKYPNCKIISVEPEKTNFELLEKNTTNFTNIHLFNSGIWNKSTNLIIEDNGYGHYGFIVKEVSEPTEKSIKALGILEIMADLEIDTIDVLKIDIEGSEKELFSSNYAEWLPKVKVIIIELHDRMKDDCAKTFFKALVNYNFEFSMKGENIVCYMKGEK